MRYFADKIVYDKYEPENTNVVWVQPTEEGAQIKAYIDGEWQLIGYDHDAYRKPASGIPESDLEESVRNAIDNAQHLNDKIDDEIERSEGVDASLNERLGIVEQLADISISGGDATIATASDFNNPTAAQKAYIPTVGAILDGADTTPTSGSGKLVTSGGVYNVINSLKSAGYVFVGVATPSTSPGTPTEKVFYIGGAGTYANFGTSVTVPVGSICVFKYNGSWTKEQIALLAGMIDDVPTANSNNLVKSGGLYNVINQLNSEGTIIPITETGKAIYLNGGIGARIGTPAVSSYNYSRQSVKQGDVVIVNGTGGGSPRLWGFVDENGIILSVADANVTEKNQYHIAPEGTAEVIINTNDTSILSLYLSKENSYTIALREQEDAMFINLNDANYLSSEWTEQYCVRSESDNLLKLTTQSGLSPKITSKMQAKAGHYYYVRVFASVNNDYCTSFVFGTNHGSIQVFNPKKNIETKVSGIFLANAADRFWFISFYSDVDSSRETTIYLDKGIIIIDLTESFGNDNIPSAETIDSMITSFNHYLLGYEKHVVLVNAYKNENFIALSDKLHLLSLSKRAQLISSARNSGAYTGLYDTSIRNPNLFYDGTTTVTDETSLTLRQNEIRTRWENMMGTLPAFDTEQEFVVLSSEVRDGYTFHTVTFEFLPAKSTTAYLLVPFDDIQDGRLENGKRPGILAPYYEPNTPSGIGHADGYFGTFALTAVKKGYIALAFGEAPTTNNFYYPNTTTPTVEPLHLLVSWVTNAVNCFVKIPNLDVTKIGIIGNSYGGKFAFMGAAFDDRIKYGVFGDYGCTFSRSNYSDDWYLGRAIPEYPNGVYNAMIANNMDISELLMLLCPRKFLLSTGTDDKNAWLALNYIKQAYDAIGETDAIYLTSRKQHQFTHDSLLQAFWFFDTLMKEY